MKVARYKVTALLAVFALTAILIACSGPGEDRPGSVEVDPQSETVSISGTGTGTGTGTATGTGAGTGTGTGTGPGAGPGDPGSSGIYTEVSNVDGYFNFALDLRDIKELIAAGDWAGAADIYQNGKGSLQGDGTLRSLQSLATSESVLAIFPDGQQVYGDPQFLNAHIQAGLQGIDRGAGLSDVARRQLVDKGIQTLLYAKAIQEIESARTRTAEGNTDNDTGAPHAVDEAAALYLGAPNEEGVRAFSLSATARSREGNFGLDGNLDTPLQQEFVALQQAAQVGDTTAFEAAEARVRGYLNSIFYLATLRYAGSTQDASVSDRPTPLAEGWAFFQAIRATVAQASPETADRINELFSSDPQAVPDTMANEVSDGLNSPAVLEALGIPLELQVK